MQLQKLIPYFSRFQIDIADGVFVDNKTITAEKVCKILTTNRSLITDNLYFDFHLMVCDYQKEVTVLERYANQIHINLVLVHFSIIRSTSFTTRNPLFSIGLAINPQDQIADLASNYALNSIPVIQIMSIKPGKQGNPFMPETLNKIEQLHLAGYRNRIYLDGGINDTTIPIIIKQKYLPDILCVGSYLTKSNNIAAKVQHLNSFV